MGGALSNEDPLWVLESLKTHLLPRHVPIVTLTMGDPPPMFVRHIKFRLLNAAETSKTGSKVPQQNTGNSETAKI